MEQNITMHKNRSLLGRRTLIGGFIAAHGIMHAALLNTPRPEGGAGNFVTRSGEVPILTYLGLSAPAVEIIGAALMMATAVGLLLAALMYLRRSRGWESGLILSSALSVVSLLLLWNDWMIMGPVISLGLVALAMRSRLAEAT